MSDKNNPSAEDRIAALEATVGQQDKTIKSLTDKLESATDPGKAAKVEKPKIPAETFTVDKKEYKFVLAEFVFKGERITAVDALTDKAILAELIKMGSGVIQEIF